ncbi:MAG: hypothetical protein U0031_13090 [Thermomicrobiales bacterium]
MVFGIGIGDAGAGLARRNPDVGRSGLRRTRPFASGDDAVQE